MQEIKGNIFDCTKNSDAICITTNGIVGATGLAVMGAGTAGEASRRWPNVRANLGRALKALGNLPYVIGYLDQESNYHDPDINHIKNKGQDCLIISFPTKNDFRFKSDVALIEKSAKLLVKITDRLKLQKVCLSRPGCSNGKLLWADVKKILEPILDDRFYIVSFEGE